MDKCILCGRKISNTKYNFGLGCLRKMCDLIKLDGIKNIKGESLLDRKILKLCNKKTLPKAQRQLLTDRYLTLNILEGVPLEEYRKYKETLKNDIDLINKSTKINELESFKLVTMKQASEIKKQYEKYAEFFQKLDNGEYDGIQNISFDIVRFAFSKYYSKKPYLSGILQRAQYGMFRGGVEVLKRFKFYFAADCLEHSLQENPENIKITKGNIINDIIDNEEFKIKVNEIIKKYENQEQFMTEKGKESLAFIDWNLFLALHNTYIEVTGNKLVDGTYDLFITVDDDYDFTDLQEIEKYINNKKEWEDILKSILGATANNFAMIADSCNVINTYHITIKFNINSREVEL